LSATFLKVIGVLFLIALSVSADTFPKEEAARFLPDQLGSFKASGPVATLERRAGQFSEIRSVGRRDYRSAKGVRLSVTVATTRSDEVAYSAFLHASSAGTAERQFGGSVGTRSLLLPDGVLFFKGPAFVDVKGGQPDARLELAHSVAANLSNGDGDIPVLVKHLPHWEKVEAQVTYTIDKDQLKAALSNQPALDGISFDGGTEAVIAPYGPAQMVLVEFTTPQLATESDQRVIAAIQQLRSQGQPVPNAYRRVGNYSVFVFNAESEQAANQLIEQIQYEQVVQWLGDNPNWLKQAQKEYTETTLGVFVTVVKTSGVAALLCFGIGGFFGAVLFARRRARQGNAEAYSDAGGMMRLNLDELSAQTNPSKLIGSGMSEKR
jgi:hypothetical protein